MSEEIATTARIQQAIRLHQGHKVMLDFDLAALYGVTTGALNRQVKRNKNRFPSDFVYEIDSQDVESDMKNDIMNVTAAIGLIKSGQYRPTWRIIRKEKQDCFSMMLNLTTSLIA